MSVLETPRIYFQGEMTWDPITTNNYDDNYNEDSGETIFPGAVDRVRAFRDNAVTQVVTAVSWNPQGTHRSTFFNTRVCGCDLGPGRPSGGDPFLNAAVNFTGMLVDVEPFGAFTSQLFFDRMGFGFGGGYFLHAPSRRRFVDRYLNFNRNPANGMIAGRASVVWQTSFAKTEGLRIDAYDSPALQALAAALAAEDVLGLTCRFNTYNTIYYDNPALSNGSPAAREEAEALVVKLRSGGFQPNPARSRLVGVVGLWRRGEPAQEPADRVLVPVSPSQGLANAWVRISENALTLDLSNSVPETGANLDKFDAGPLTIIASDPDPASGVAVMTLATIPYAAYNRAAYEASAGIVVVPLAPAIAHAAAEMNLSLQSNAGNLTEETLRAVSATPDLYLDEGQSAEAAFQVWERGRPAQRALALTLYQMSANGGSLDNSFPVNTDAGGGFAWPIHANAGDIFAYVPSFGAQDSPAANGLNPQVNTYMYVRMRPADEVLAQLPSTWANVYRYVLANWNAMAPCMDNWLHLDNPVEVKAFAPLLRRLTDPANFESFLFMPVTRDMSAGMRSLLYRFLDAPPEPAAVSLQAATPAAPLSFAARSRAQRRPAGAGSRANQS